MNAPQSTSDSTAVAPAQSVRFTLPAAAPAGADPRDRHITGGYVDTRGSGLAQLARYLPPAAPRGEDPRDRHITGGYVRNGEVAPAEPSRRPRIFLGYELADGESVAMLAPCLLNT